jgi:hypothetical protein
LFVTAEMRPRLARCWLTRTSGLKITQAGSIALPLPLVSATRIQRNSRCLGRAEGGSVSDSDPKGGQLSPRSRPASRGSRALPPA